MQRIYETYNNNSMFSMVSNNISSTMASLLNMDSIYTMIYLTKHNDHITKLHLTINGAKNRVISHRCGCRYCYDEKDYLCDSEWQIINLIK